MLWISPAQRYVFTATIKFVPQDLWVGVFWRRYISTLEIYICLLPTLPIKLTLVDLIDLDPTPDTPTPTPS